MKISSINILNNRLRKMLILTTFFLFILNFCSFLFFKNSYSISIYLFSVFILFYTLFFICIFFNYWALKDENKFIYQLFIISTIVGIIYAIFYLIYFNYNHDSLFEFNAKDSIQYYNQALIIYENIISGSSLFKGLIPFVKFEDLGFSTYLTLLFYLFYKSVYVIILFNIVIKSLCAVYVYKITAFLFNQVDAKLSATIFVFLPVLNYFSSIVLKEILMIFMFLVMVYHLILFLENKKLKHFILLIIFSIGMLFIRPVNSIIILSIIPIHYLINLKSLNVKTLFIFSILVGFIFTQSKQPFLQDSISIIERSSTQFESSISYSESRKGGNKLASNASIPMLYGLSFFTPLATSTAIKNQEHFWIHLSNNFLLGTLSLFFIYALYKLYRDKKYTSIISVILIYFLVITIAGLSTSVRRYLPVVPFILILIPYGIRTIKKNFIYKFLSYNFFILLLTFAWNLFKLIGKN